MSSARCVFLVACFAVFTGISSAQIREASPLVYEKAYTYANIHKSLRDLIDQNEKKAYFNDNFFNGTLAKILDDRQWTDVERVQLFYLMLKKIGYAFSGVEYIPPTQNYFMQHCGKIYVFENTAKGLAHTKLPVHNVLRVAEQYRLQDPLLAGNALLLATLMRADTMANVLTRLADANEIMKSKQPAIFNHYVCLSASMVQSDTLTKTLAANLKVFTEEEMLEDVICAMYTKRTPVRYIREYVLAEKNPANDLALQTALNALASKVPEATYQQSLKSLASVPEKWKAELIQKMQAGKIPFNYSLSDPEQLVTKVWNNFTLSLYTNGSLVSRGDLMEFDPN